MDSIGIAGDWHADYEWAAASIRTLAKRGLHKVLHVGDFGIIAPTILYLDPLEALLARHDITIYVTPGNHENYDMVDTAPVLNEHNGMPAGLLQLTPHILLMPRGYRWVWDDVSYISLGGGNSIDKRNLVPHVSWWPQETITLGDIMRATADGTADVMIAHVAPAAAQYQLISLDWDEAAITYSDESRTMMQHAVDDIHPKLFLHGHYHIDKLQQVIKEGSDGEPYATVYASLGRNTKKNNLGVLDPSTLQLGFIPWPDGQAPERRD